MVFDDVFAVHDLKVIERKDDKTLFVAMPYRKTSQGKQLDIAHPINSDMRRELETSIIEKYNEALSEAQTADADAGFVSGDDKTETADTVTE